MFELIGRFLDKLASGCLVVVIALVILIAAIIVLFSYPLETVIYFNEESLDCKYDPPQAHSPHPRSHVLRAPGEPSLSPTIVNTC